MYQRPYERAGDVFLCLDRVVYVFDVSWPPVASDGFLWNPKRGVQPGAVLGDAVTVTIFTDGR